MCHKTTTPIAAQENKNVNRHRSAVVVEAVSERPRCGLRHGETEHMTSVDWLEACMVVEARLGFRGADTHHGG